LAAVASAILDQVPVAFQLLAATPGQVLAGSSATCCPASVATLDRVLGVFHRVRSGG